MTFLFWNGNQNAKKKWKFEINVREHRRGNQKRTFLRIWQHSNKTKKKKKRIKTQHNMCWIPLYTNKQK
jgi:hypothetical protein